MIVLKGDFFLSKRQSKMRVVPIRDKRQIRYFVTTPNRFEQAREDALVSQLTEQKREWRDMVAETDAYPVHVFIHVYKANHRTFRYVDVAAFVTRAMVRAGYIPSDAMRHILPIVMKYRLDKANPRIEIKAFGDESAKIKHENSEAL